jgi:hypothetical protein
MHLLRRIPYSFLLLVALTLAGVGLATNSSDNTVRPEQARANPAPTMLGNVAGSGDLTGVYDVVIGTISENFVHCIANLDENGSNVTGVLVCYGDVALALPPSTNVYLTKMDGIFGPPPPPPYAPARGMAVGTIVGNNVTAATCVTLDSIAVYLEVAFDKISLTGTANVYLGSGGQEVADCEAGTPQGDPVELSVTLTPRVDPDPDGLLDYDNDGCLDVDELDPDPFSGPWGGFDPYNPFDCDSDFNSIFYIESTLLSQTPGAPGMYLYCVADLQGTQMRPFCYLDSPSFVVNPAAVPLPNVGATNCPPAPPAYCGDGIILPGPPPPYAAVRTTTANSELTGSTGAGGFTGEGCFQFGGNLGYVRANFSSTSGQGTIDVWQSWPACPAPPAPASPETGLQCDNAANDDPGDDGFTNDGCPQVGTLAETGAQCANNTDDDATDAAETAAGRKINDGCSAQGINAPAIASAVVRAVEQGPSMDTDRDGCPDRSELSNNQLTGGRRDPLNRYDYFNPSKDGLNRIDDVVLVVHQYFIDDPLGSPDLNSQTDRTAIPGSNSWNLGPPNGLQRIDDILNIVKQYFHDCANYVTVLKPPWSEIETPAVP